MGHGNHRAQPPGPVCARMATSPSRVSPATLHRSPEGRADDAGGDTAGDRDAAARGHQDTVFMGVSRVVGSALGSELLALDQPHPGLLLRLGYWNP